MPFKRPAVQALLLLLSAGFACALGVDFLRDVRLTSESEGRVTGEVDWPFQGRRIQLYSTGIHDEGSGGRRSLEIQGPVRNPSTETDAWVWMMHEKRPSTTIYDPIVFTLVEALYGAGANVARVGIQTRDAMLANVTAAIGRGRQPLIVVVGFAWAVAGKDILKQCGELGAFIVLYQSEPTPNLAKLEPHIELFKAREVWDYSRRNLDWYPQSAKSMYRYMPPGYARDLDFGVQLASDSFNVTRVGFLGQWIWRSRRTQTVYNEVFGESLVTRGNVWTQNDTVEFLTQYPIQLNTHKGENCCPSHNPIEAFRMAQLIANRACVISAHSDPRDELEWEGIIHFAEASEMAHMFQKVSEDVRGCQNSSFETFKTRFDPYAILNRSGFLKAWQPGK